MSSEHEPALRGRRLARLLLALALLLHGVLAWGYVVRTPAWEAPDEADHYGYAFVVGNRGVLPVMRKTAERLGRPWLDEGGLAHHPPLYYLGLAALLRAAGHADTLVMQEQNPPPYEGPGKHLLWRHGEDERPPVSHEIVLLRALRALSILLGSATIVATFVLARLAFPREPPIAGAAALLLAALPCVQSTHAALDNGNLAALLSHLALLPVLAALFRGRLRWSDALVAALLLALALNTKLTALVLVPLLLGVTTIAALRTRRGERGPLLFKAFVATALVGLASAWFFVRNVRLYGDPLGAEAHRAVYAINVVPAGERVEWLLHGFLPEVFASLLGRFGAQGQLAPHPLAVAAGALVLALGLLGLVARGLARARLTAAQRPALAPALVLAAAFLAVFAATAQFNLTFKQPQGRYLLPALGPLAIVVAAGLVELRRRSGRAGFPAGLAAVGLAVVLPCVVFARVFVPAFDPATVPAGPLHASLVAGATARSEPPAIEQLSPQDGAVLAAPPELRWRPKSAAGEGPPRYALYVFDEEGRVHLAVHEWLHAAPSGESFTLPAVAFEALPIGVPLIWNVRRVADRSRGEDPRDMPCGAGARFVRSR